MFRFKTPNQHKCDDKYGVYTEDKKALANLLSGFRKISRIIETEEHFRTSKFKIL